MIGGHEIGPSQSEDEEHFLPYSKEKTAGDLGHIEEGSTNPRSARATTALLFRIGEILTEI